MFRAVPSDLFFKLPVLGTFRDPYGDQNGLKKFFWDFHVFQYGQLPYFHGRNFKNSETFFSRYDPYLYLRSGFTLYRIYKIFYTIFFIFLLRLMKKNKIQNLKKPPWNHRLKLGPFLLIDYD